MTLAELLVDLKTNSFVDEIVVNPALQVNDTAAKSKWYRLTYREIVGKVMVNRSIDIYVIDEGTAKERAYYKDREPTAQITAKAIV